jgi:hypothetical protein
MVELLVVVRDSMILAFVTICQRLVGTQGALAVGLLTMRDKGIRSTPKLDGIHMIEREPRGN